MDVSKPDFIDTEWFYYDDNGNMRLKDGAPSKVRREFNRFVNAYTEWQRSNEQGFNEELTPTELPPIELEPPDL